MRKLWVRTDPQIIVVEEYARKTAKVVALLAALYVMSYAAGRAVGEHAMKQLDK